MLDDSQMDIRSGTGTVFLNFCNDRHDGIHIRLVALDDHQAELFHRLDRNVAANAGSQIFTGNRRLARFRCRRRRISAAVVLSDKLIDGRLQIFCHLAGVFFSGDELCRLVRSLRCRIEQTDQPRDGSQLIFRAFQNQLVAFEVHADREQWLAHPLDVFRREDANAGQSIGTVVDHFRAISKRAEERLRHRLSVARFRFVPQRGHAECVQLAGRGRPFRGLFRRSLVVLLKRGRANLCLISRRKPLRLTVLRSSFRSGVGEEAARRAGSEAVILSRKSLSALSATSRSHVLTDPLT